VIGGNVSRIVPHRANRPTPRQPSLAAFTKLMKTIRITAIHGPGCDKNKLAADRGDMNIATTRLPPANTRRGNNARHLIPLLRSNTLTPNDKEPCPIPKGQIGRALFPS
jgi:hypothetical protein